MTAVLADGLTPAEDVAAGLHRLCTALGADLLPCGPQGHAVVPVSIARTARWVWSGGRYTDRVRYTEAVATEPLLAREGLVALRLRPRTGQPAPAEPELLGWIANLAWLRLGLSERLLDDCLGYLGSRTTGGAPLIDQQMIKGDLTEARIEQLEVRAVLPVASGARLSAAELRQVHWHVTGADRILLRLLGASGFLADGPGQRAYASERIADAYLPGGCPHGEECR